MSAPPPAPGANQTVEPYSIPISGSDDGSDDASSDDDATPNQGETKSTNRSSSTSRSAANPFTATTTSTGSAAAIDRDTSSMQEREVFSFGQNSYGELGHGHTEERRVPVRIEFCRGKNIVCIAAGNEHTCLLSDTGVVYAAGYNDSGQCGTGNSGRVPSLQAVESFRGRGVVRLISSNGCEHTSAITEDGELWTCGYNARGQLGHGNKTHQSVPRLVDSLRAYRVKHVSCSYYHSIVACEDDKIFGFGRNDYGQLGLGHNDDKLRPTPIAFFHGQRVVDIACGQYHSLVSVGSGGIFAFGKNDYGASFHWKKNLFFLPGKNISKIFFSLSLTQFFCFLLLFLFLVSLFHFFSLFFVLCSFPFLLLLLLLLLLPCLPIHLLHQPPPPSSLSLSCRTTWNYSKRS